MEGKKELVMGTRKEALTKVSGALKELTVAFVGWPWIKKRPMQLNVGRVQDDVEAFKVEFDRFADKAEFDIKIISAAVNDAQDGVAEVRKLLQELKWVESVSDKRIEVLEKTVSDISKYVTGNSSLSDPKHHAEYVPTPKGEQPTRHHLHGVQNQTKEDMAEYANWARDAGVFAPISYNGSDSPLAEWGSNKRSRMLRLMLDLGLVQIVTEGGYGGPKTVVFSGTLSTWKYTARRLDKISIDLFKSRKGKWPGTKALAQIDSTTVDLSPAELVDTAEKAYESGDPEQAEELYDRAIELGKKADGVVTKLPEYKDEGAEQKNYHVSATDTDLSDGWADKYRDKRGNREY